MSDGVFSLLMYLLGWFIFSTGYYIYKVYIDKDIHTNKKLHIWRGFWLGIFSWIGIIFVLSFMFTGLIFTINEWVEDKLR